jgi:hypothetical protein
MLHLLQKSPNQHSTSPLVVHRNYPNLEGEFGPLLIDSIVVGSNHKIAFFFSCVFINMHSFHHWNQWKQKQA